MGYREQGFLAELIQTNEKVRELLLDFPVVTIKYDSHADEITFQANSLDNDRDLSFKVNR